MQTGSLVRWVVGCCLVGAAACSGPSQSGGNLPDPGPASCEPVADSNQLFYVAEDGDDGAEGSEARPWTTIEHAIGQVPDDSTILVSAGTYSGRIRLDAQFEKGVTIRSQTPYAARLRNDEAVVTIYRGQGITLSGFDIAHDGDGAGALVIHIQDLIDEPGGSDAVSRIVLRNNIIHDSYNNDILKINNGATDVLVERNIFYNQEGSDEHIDINSVARVTVQDNIFFNDFEASGRDNGSDTSSFVVIKDSNGDDDGFEGAEDIAVRRNIFLNWQGAGGANFVLVGEDGNSYFEATNVMIESNLLVGNSSDSLRAPLGIKGASEVTFRNNTVVGDMPGDAFAFRFNQEGDNQANDKIFLFNNIWSDPTGSMDDFSDAPEGETDGFQIDNNLYYNGGSAIPSEDSDMIGITDDSNALEADPIIGSGNRTMPTWDSSELQFRDGSGDICAAFEALAAAYGTPASNSPVKGAADSSNASETDLLGNRRTMPSIGAIEP